MNVSWPSEVPTSKSRLSSELKLIVRDAELGHQLYVIQPNTYGRAGRHIGGFPWWLQKFLPCSSVLCFCLSSHWEVGLVSPLLEPGLILWLFWPVGHGGNDSACCLRSCSFRSALLWPRFHAKKHRVDSWLMEHMRRTGSSLLTVQPSSRGMGEAVWEGLMSKTPAPSHTPEMIHHSFLKPLHLEWFVSEQSAAEIVDNWGFWFLGTLIFLKFLI